MRRKMTRQEEHEKEAEKQERKEGSNVSPEIPDRRGI